MASGDPRAALASRRLARWSAVAMVLAAWLVLMIPSGALAQAGAGAPGSIAGQSPNSQLAKTLRALEGRDKALGRRDRRTPGTGVDQPSNGAQAAAGGAASTGAAGKATGGTPASAGSLAAGTTGATAPGATTPTTTVTTTTTATPGATGATPTTAATPPARAHASSSSPSTPAIVLAVIAAILVLLSLAWALARALAYEPSWMPSLRHSFAEAGFRASATFAELGDWLRLGR